MIRTLRTAACVMLALAATAHGAEPDATAARFDAQIAPILARRCLDCHNASDRKGGLDLTTAEAASRGGDSGPALTAPPGETALLAARVAAGEMPPETALPDEEREALLDWMARGTAWGQRIDRFRFSSEKRAGYDWWSLQPVRRSDPPVGANSPPAASPIDAFLAARLHVAGLMASPPAERRALMRRLSFDLHGLPPEPEEQAEFLADDRPDAYARLVDRMLASPRYGERWARHWLDVARFGESQGFEYDKLRPTAYRYRDWVIAALNDDLPYDDFLRRQIAGDALSDDSSAAVPTGFLVAGPWDQAGQMQQSAAMRAVVRQDELEDLIGVTSQAVMGLTVNCARCHDHKFDPVTQVEYYQMAAALSGVTHGEPPLDERYAAQSATAAALSRERQALADRLAAQEAALRRRWEASAVATVRAPGATPPQPRWAWDFRRPRAEVDPQGKIELRGGAVWDAQGLHVAPRERYAVLPLEADLGPKTLEAWVRLSDTTQQGGAALSVERPDGSAFDAIVFGERAAGRWMAGSEGFVRTRDLVAEPETAEPRQLIHVAVTYSAEGEVRVYRHGGPYGEPYRTSPPPTFQAGAAQVLFGLRHSPHGPNKLLHGVIVRAQIYDRALAPEEVAASAANEPQWYDPHAVFDLLTAEERQARDGLLRELAHLESQLSRAAMATTYAVISKQPPPTAVLARGNPAQPGDTVSAGGVRALGPEAADWGLPPDAPEAERRRRLAEWLTRPEHPLTARVIVNRLWQHHFGVGLVDTPNDFGYSGGRPSHPELLDWLASELIDGGWRLKPLHRLMVTSAAYQQASLPRAEALAVDADNRLLWRASPRRLDAEALRDALLAVSGQLNLALGGPGFHDFRAYLRDGTQFYEPWDGVGPSFQRRSVYRTWARSGRNPLLDALDCPDPSTTTPRRAITTTPLQALALLNQAFVLRSAAALADRAQSEAGPELAQRIERAYTLALGRRPDAEERDLAVAHATEHGLAALCRVLLNTSEFLYVD